MDRPTQVLPQDEIREGKIAQYSRKKYQRIFHILAPSQSFLYRCLKYLTQAGMATM